MTVQAGVGKRRASKKGKASFGTGICLVKVPERGDDSLLYRTYEGERKNGGNCRDVVKREPSPKDRYETGKNKKFYSNF